MKLPNWKKKKNSETADWQPALFSRDKEEICDALLLMAEKAVRLATHCVDSLLAGGADESLWAKETDGEIDRLEMEIEDLCLGALALRQPVRADLRFIFSALKTITDLERVGDQGVNIARRAALIGISPLPEAASDFKPMMTLAGSMVLDGVQALVQDDLELARQVALRDNQVDSLQRQTHKALLRHLRDNPAEDALSDRITALVIVGRCIERIGDHGANIAERAYYAGTGERLKEGDNANEHR